MRKVIVATFLAFALVFIAGQSNQAEAEAGSDGWVVNIRTYLSIREYPTVYSRELARVPNGTYLYVLNRKGDFYYVEYNGIYGYAHCAYVSTNW